MQRRGDRPAVRTVDGGICWSWRDLDAIARRVAAGLRNLGVCRGDTVGLLMTNRPEFFACDLAIVMLGAIPVSIYTTSAPEQIAHVVSDAGLSVVLHDGALADLARAGGPGCWRVDIDAGFEDLCASPGCEPVPVSAEDLLTIIYTSGTTGRPKGVELTHRSLLFAMHGVGARKGLREGAITISWLPMAHIGERNASYYGGILFGAEIVTCPDSRQLLDYLVAVRPNWLFAVPRIWEKLRARIEADGDKGLLVDDVRTLVGLDRIEAASVGAAASSSETTAFFHRLGVPVAEIYGQTEACACATANPPDDIRVGTVGTAIEGVELVVADDGEVLLRGPHLMRGYRNQPAETRSAFTADGFLRTGDIGTLDPDGYLTIVGRKKDIFINASGKNMSPVAIEAAIKRESALIAQVVAMGEGRAYNVALVTLDPEALGERGIADPAVRAAVDAAVARGNRRLSRVEQVKAFHVVDDMWVPGGEELTPTLKLRRPVIASRYAAEIEALYARGQITPSARRAASESASKPSMSP